MPTIFNQSPQNALAQGVHDLKALAETQAQDILTTFQQFTEFVWDHPTFTPQQVLEAFGQDAAKLFALASVASTIYEIVFGTPPSVIPPGYIPQFNPDGTVTLNYVPPTNNL